MTSALVVGTIIGSGIFMLPVSLAPLGLNALIGWLISGVGVHVHRLRAWRGCRGSAAAASRPMSSAHSGRPPAFLVAVELLGLATGSRRPRSRSPARSALSFIGPQFGDPDAIVPVAIGWLVVLTARQRASAFARPAGSRS